MTARTMYATSPPCLPITEHQQQPANSTQPRQWPSDYRYLGYDPTSGLHMFQQDGGAVELFARRKSPPAGWHLRRGTYTFEYCRASDDMAE